MRQTQTKTLEKYKKDFEGQVTQLEKDLQVKYSEAVVKSVGFDKLTNHPMFATFWNDLESGKPYGYSSEFRKGNSKDDTEAEGSAESNGKGVTVESIMKQLLPAIDKVIERKLGPINQERSQKIWTDAEKLPDFNKHRACGRGFLSRGNTAGAKLPLRGRDRPSRDIG